MHTCVYKVAYIRYTDYCLQLTNIFLILYIRVLKYFFLELLNILHCYALLKDIFNGFLKIKFKENITLTTIIS